MTGRVTARPSTETHDQPCYADDDIARIAASYRLRSDDVWPIWFKERLERIAWIYRETKAEEKPAIPSATIRRMEALRQRARYLTTILDAADFRLQGELDLAARELADMYGLPDFEAEVVVYESIPPGDPITKTRWPVERQLYKSRQAVDYLVAVFDTALRRMTDEKEPGGNRADEHLHEIVRALDSFYRETAADPRNPYFDSVSGVEKGELLSLLHASLYPLGVHLDSSSALLSRWQRAIGQRT